MVVRMRRTRNVAWGAAAAGAGTLVAAYPLEQDWMIGTGAAVLGGGMVAALWAGSMLRHRCRGVDEFDLRYDRGATIAGRVLIGIGAALAVTGILVVVEQPFESDDDPAIVNSFVGFLGFVLPGVVLTATGAGLLLMRSGRASERTQAWIGPGTITLRTRW